MVPGHNDLRDAASSELLKLCSYLLYNWLEFIDDVRSLEVMPIRRDVPKRKNLNLLDSSTRNVMSLLCTVGQ